MQRKLAVADLEDGPFVCDFLDHREFESLTVKFRKHSNVLNV